MSLSDARSFIDRAQSDQGFRNQFVGLEVESMTDIVQFAGERGYKFGVDDLEEAYRSKILQKPNLRLTEPELRELSITPDYMALYLVSSNSTSGCDDCNQCTSNSDEC